MPSWLMMGKFFEVKLRHQTDPRHMKRLASAASSGSCGLVVADDVDDEINRSGRVETRRSPRPPTAHRHLIRRRRRTSGEVPGFDAVNAGWRPPDTPSRTAGRRIDGSRVGGDASGGGRDRAMPILVPHTANVAASPRTNRRRPGTHVVAPPTSVDQPARRDRHEHRGRPSARSRGRLDQTNRCDRRAPNTAAAPT